MQRSGHVARLRSEAFDLLVIGGGITGAGAAFDAATRRLKVALVEKDDFASGTSSRSSKLLHGGLRYLQRLHLGIVREGLRERRENARMAHHLVTQTRFVLPRYPIRGGAFRRIRSWHLGVRAGLTLYDVLSIGSGYPRHRSLSASQVLELAPALRDDVDGGLEYWDASVDDARLVWAVVRSTVEARAAVANHAEVIGLVREDGKVCGARVRDTEDGSTFEVRARVVINATGVWADDVRRLEAPDAPSGIRPSKGIHLVFRAADLPLDTALLLPAPDRRFVFVIPWEDGTVIVGTTDEAYTGSLDEPRAEPGEVAHLLRVINTVLAEPLSEDDIVSTFAGLRPLVASGQPSKDISRRHVVDVGPSGLVTILGGKLTAWRPMAEHVVDAALEAGGFDVRPPSRTRRIDLLGSATRQGVVPALEAVLDDLGVDTAHAPRLYHRYGAHSAEVLRLIRHDMELAQPVHPELPYLCAEAEYAIRTEMATRPRDVLARRLRAELTSTDGGRVALDWVCERLAIARGWSDDRRRAEIESYR